MARPVKEGLDYFELDCHMEEKVRLIQAEFGLKGFAIVVKLYQKIYGGFGYYCEWNEDSLLLFMSENGVSSRDEKNLISEIVAACIRRNIFSEKLFNEFGILTSYGVQKRYLNAVSRREKVELIKEYLLISVGKNQCNVCINSINDYRNSVNVCSNSQSREEKSREENICTRASRFQDFFSAYPKQKNVIAAEKEYMLVLINDQSLTEQELIIAAENYSDTVSILGTEERYIKNPDRFLKDGTYLDYMDVNYIKPKPTKKKRDVNAGMMRTDYGDLSELEKELLAN